MRLLAVVLALGALVGISFMGASTVHAKYTAGAEEKRKCPDIKTRTFRKRAPGIMGGFALNFRIALEVILPTRKRENRDLPLCRFSSIPANSIGWWTIRHNTDAKAKDFLMRMTWRYVSLTDWKQVMEGRFPHPRHRDAMPYEPRRLLLVFAPVRAQPQATYLWFGQLDKAERRYVVEFQSYEITGILRTSVMLSGFKLAVREFFQQNLFGTSASDYGSIKEKIISTFMDFLSQKASGEMLQQLDEVSKAGWVNFWAVQFFCKDAGCPVAVKEWLSDFSAVMGLVLFGQQQLYPTDPWGVSK